jgi:Tfp pilus assembly protein PilN
MSTMTFTTAQAVLPRVNLLPVEFAERRQLRRLQMGLGLGVIASVAVVCALYVGAVSDVADAQDGLDESIARNQQLMGEVSSYSEVPQIFAQAAAAENQVRTTMASEVQWSKSLQWLMEQTPDGVWLSNVSIQQHAGDAATLPPANGWNVAGIGAVTFEGKAYRYENVSTWMETLATRPGFTQPYVSSAAQEDSLRGANGKPVISFTSKVTVDENALSRRHPIKAGN